MSDFIYKLNAMETAAASDNPHPNGYGDKRAAVLAYVSELEKELESRRRGEWICNRCGLRQEPAQDSDAWW